MENKKYLFKDISDSRMLLWTSTSTQRYLTAPTGYIPKNLIDVDNGKIRMPPNPKISQLERVGFFKAGFESKSGRSFYQYAQKERFARFILVIKGKLPISFDGKKQILLEDDVLIIPPNLDLTVYGSKSTPHIFWLHCDKRWNFSPNIFIKKMTRAKQLFFLASAYSEEIYSKNPNVSFLRALAESIAECIRVEFFDNSQQLKNNVIEKALRENHQIMNARALAKQLGISIFEIDEYCQKKYGLNLTKLLLKTRMESALKILKQKNSSCLQASKVAGYKTQFAFSKAFKKYYGLRPSKFLKTSN